MRPPVAKAAAPRGPCTTLMQASGVAEACGRRQAFGRPPGGRAEGVRFANRPVVPIRGLPAAWGPSARPRTTAPASFLQVRMAARKKLPSGRTERLPKCSHRDDMLLVDLSQGVHCDKTGPLAAALSGGGTGRGRPAAASPAARLHRRSCTMLWPWRRSDGRRMPMIRVILVPRIPVTRLVDAPSCVSAERALASIAEN